MLLKKGHLRSNFWLYLLLITLSLVFVNVLFKSDVFISDGFDSKLIVFNGLAALLTASLCVFGLTKRIILDYIDIGVFILFAYIVVRYLVENPVFNNVLIGTILTLPLCICLKNIIHYSNRADVLSIIVSVILVIAFCESFYAVLQLCGIIAKNTQYVSGTFKNSGVFSIYLAAIFTFSLAYSLNYSKTTIKESIVKALSLINVFLGFILVPATHSRSCWIAVAVIAFGLLIQKYRSKILVLPRKTRLIALTLVIALIIFSGFSSYHLKKDSADGRVVIWGTGLLVLKSHALFGIGFNQIKNKFFDYQAAYFEKYPSDAVIFPDKVEYTFNDFLQLGTENGVIAMLLVVSIGYTFVGIFVGIIVRDAYFFGAFGGFCCILICGLFSYPLETISISSLFFLFMSVIVSTNNNRVIYEIKIPYFFIIFFAGILFSGYIVWQQQNYSRSKYFQMVAKTNTEYEDFNSALINYSTALTYTPYEKEILLGYGLTQLKIGNFQGAIKTLSSASQHISDPFLYNNLGLAFQKSGSYKYAEDNFRKSVAIMPNRMYPQFLLVNLLYETKNFQKASAEAQKMLKMEVKVESQATLEMKAQILEKLNNMK